MASRDLVVRVIGDSRSVERAFGRSAKAAKDFNVSMVRTRDIVKGVFASAGLAVGVAGFARGIQGSVNAASNLEEQINKVNVVFGDSAGNVQKWSRTVTAAFGLSRREALETAGSFGLILKGAGLTEKDAAGLSKRLTELGADLASFNNIKTDEALQKLRAGLSGEAEPLRALGVDLTEGAVKARAYKEGIAETGEELTQQQKVLARYAQIVAQTGDAQGDAERTAGSYANVMRRLGSVLENLQASIGQALLPALTQITAALGEFLADTENQARVQKAVQDAVKLTATAFRTLYDIFQAIAPVVRTLVGSLGGLERTVKLLAAAFVGVKVAAFITGLQTAATAASTATTKVTALRIALNKLTLIGPITIAVSVIIFREEITKFFNDLTDKLPFGRGREIEIPVGVGRLDGLKAAREQFVKLDGEASSSVKAVDKLIASIEGVKSKKVTLEVETIVTGAARPRRETGGGQSAAGQSILGAIESVIEGSKKAVADATRKVKAGLKTEQLEKALEERNDAFAKFIAALRLGVDRAELTSGLQNDLDALQRLKAGLQKQIKAGVDVASAQSELVGVTAEIAAKQAEISANSQKIAQARQFRALGLTAAGDEIIPGVKNLQTRITNALRQIDSGQIDVSSKIEQRLKLARALIKREGGKVTGEVRSFINDLLKSLSGLDKIDADGPLTKTTSLNVQKFLQNVSGLSRDQEKQLRANLSSFNSAGMALARPGTPGTTIGGQRIVVENNNTIELDGQVVSRNVTKSQTKTSRGTRQKRGPNRRSGI